MVEWIEGAVIVYCESLERFDSIDTILCMVELMGWALHCAVRVLDGRSGGESFARRPCDHLMAGACTSIYSK